MVYVISDEESERIRILKFWFCIMVVFIHSYVVEEPSWLYGIEYIISGPIASCAVPTFFFLSAVFLFRKDFSYRENVIKKVKSLVVPYFIINTFWVCVMLIAQNIEATSVLFSGENKVITEWNWIDWLDAFLGVKTGKPLVFPLWYLRDLMLLNLTAPIIKWMIDKAPRIVLILLGIVMLFNIQTNLTIINQCSIVYFSLGYYFVKYGLHFSDIKIKPVVISMIYGVSICLYYLWKNSEFVHIINIIVIICGAIFFYVCTTNLRCEKIKKFVLRISPYGFTVYLFHELSMVCLIKVLLKLMPDGSFSLLLIYFGAPIIIIVGSILFCVLMEKYAPLIYEIVTGNRR